MSVSEDRPFRVLIVDDKQDERFAIKKTIEGTGLFCEFVEARSVTEAENILKNQKIPFDLTVVDHKLEEPPKDGTTLISIIRSVLNRYSQTRIILFTAYPCWETACAAYEAGADSCISKNDDDASKKLKQKAVELLQQRDLRQGLLRSRQAHQKATETFERNKEQLIKEYGGKFVVFHNGQIQESGDDPFDVWKVLDEKYTKDQRYDVSVIQIPREEKKQ